MKIMYFMDNNHILGGAAHTLLRQAQLMKIAGHQVIIVLDNAVGKTYEAYENFCVSNSMEMRYLPLSTSNQPEDIDVFFVFEHFNETKKAIEKEAPDLLHSVQMNLTAELAARELGIPHVMNIYPVIPDFFRLDYINAFPRYHICDSWYYADMWRKYLHTESVCIRTVADEGKVHRACLKAGHILKCICVGAVYKSKNQLAVIKACHKAIENGINLRLLIYGNYEGNLYGQECIDYIKENTLTPFIELKGFCNDMHLVYQKNDVLICGSTRESYPNVVSEALANGVVVISTPVAGVPEVIKDKKNGYLCQGHTVDDIYEKIAELNADIENGMIREIMQDAEITYEKVHSPKSVMTKLEQYYRLLLENFDNKKTISIDSLKKSFEGVMNTYYTNESMFSDKEKVKRKLWYLYHIQSRIKNQIERKRKFYIWGTGKYGKNVYELVMVYFENMKVSGFIDSFKSGQYMGQEVYKPEEVLKDDGIVILVATVNGQTEIIEQLIHNGKEYIDDYYILSKRWW